MQVSYDVHTHDSILVIVELDSTAAVEVPAHNCIDHSVEDTTSPLLKLVLHYICQILWLLSVLFHIVHGIP